MKKEVCKIKKVVLTGFSSTKKLADETNFSWNGRLWKREDRKWNGTKLLKIDKEKPHDKELHSFFENLQKHGNTTINGRTES